MWMHAACRGKKLKEADAGEGRERRRSRFTPLLIEEGSAPLEGLAAMEALGKWAEGDFAFSEHDVEASKEPSQRIPKVRPPRASPLS